MNQYTENTDRRELDKFASLAEDWWDPRGKLRTLHHINPMRLRYVDRRVGLKGKKVLDLGCGGGVLSEAMARAGALVTGIDANQSAITAAIDHCRGEDLTISYYATTAELFAMDHHHVFDAIICMELLEHVPDVPSLLASCALMLRPGGHLILSTINRNALSYASVVLTAEYLLGLLPRGTHDYSRFIRPSELAAWLRSAGFELQDIAGMTYIPGLNTGMINNRPAVNYLAHAVVIT
jgi:2-polyprenyl-6-hydroxyphenyl methylase/3-demethylubiquinone-9 3-methyltransferase